jgi:hypothetical protein
MSNHSAGGTAPESLPAIFSAELWFPDKASDRTSRKGAPFWSRALWRSRKPPALVLILYRNLSALADAVFFKQIGREVQSEPGSGWHGHLPVDRHRRMSNRRQVHGMYSTTSPFGTAATGFRWISGSR